MSGPEDIAAALASVAADTYAEPEEAPAEPVPTEPAEPTEAPAPLRGLGRLSARPAVACWRLEGPAGRDMQILPAFLINCGCSVEAITPQTAYRVTGNHEWLRLTADALAEKIDTARLDLERAKPGEISIAAVADSGRNWRRRQYVQGANAHGLVTRAIDMRLTVTPAGIERWCITGPGATQAAWVAEASGSSVANILAAWGITAEALAREDDAAPTITVDLPDREITTDLIDRDAEGRLRRVVQIETTRR